MVPQMNSFKVCKRFHFNDVWKAYPTCIPLFPGVTLAFALSLLNQLTNHRL
jgi:hypothetical protein